MKSAVERGVDTPSQGQHERTARTADGIVTELMPSALYRVRLDDGPSVVAHIADRIDRNFVRVLVGDRVRVELSPLDLGRGRIVERLRS
jgi:translation initiation factor IF-1